MLRESVEQILAQVLKRKNALFLIDLTVSADNVIRIVLDGDQDVSLQDCIAVSREIEHNLNREEMDFSLEVSSAGATAPIALPRQYTKNIGRTLQVETQQESFKGRLTAVSGDSITLEWKAREPKPTGKGKVTVQKNQRIAISDIKEAKVVLKF